jgi:hypothetical protein
MVAERAGSLWVVTSYFNPASYQRRRTNFRAFRRQLGAPLLVVELAKPGRHELGDDDGEIVVQLEGEDRLWQKERLLNLAIAQLPSAAKYVAWMDCDLIFGDRDWAAKAEAHLCQHGGLLQLFARSVHLPSTLDASRVSLDDCRAAEPIVTGVAIARAVAAANFEANEEKLQRARKAVGAPNYYPTLDKHNCYGMAWAARRDVIGKVGLYDRNVIGGADSIQIFAALSRLDDYWNLRASTEPHKRDVVRWAEAARTAGLFDGLAALEGDVYHLWHGDFANRNYRGRHEALVRRDFDPARDIEPAANGTWRWTNPQGPLAAEVAAYFFARCEDGDARLEAPAERERQG